MNGIIPLFKPRGLTSHDCVYRVRKILKMKKVGHTGTLDPNVEGVLPICVGEATKIIPFVHSYQKEYMAEVTLGKATTTEDDEGQIIDSKTIEKMPTFSQIETVLSRFKGDIVQIPPMYSAVKVKGKKLYEYARKGLTVERPERAVKVFSIQCLNIKNDAFTFKVRCSKGTYVRTLCVDIGKALGYPAYMSHLKRTESDGIKIDDTISLNDLEQQSFLSCTYPIASFLDHIPTIEVNQSEVLKVLNGQRYQSPRKASSMYKMMYQDTLLGIFKIDPKNQNLLKPQRIFNLYQKEGVQSENS